LTSHKDQSSIQQLTDSPGVNRGHRREAIFTDDKGREEFLARLAALLYGNLEIRY